MRKVISIGIRKIITMIILLMSTCITASAYYHISPYVYCGGNPVKYVDPDGRRIVFSNGVSSDFKKQFAKTIQYMNSKGTGDLLKRLQIKKEIIYIKATKNVSSSYNTNSNTIKWNPYGGVITSSGVILSPATVLNHEADHALQQIDNPKQKEKDLNTPDDKYKNNEEKRVITGSEQETARKHGEIKANEVTCTDHGGQPFLTTSPTSTLSKNEIVVTPKKKKDEL